MRLSDIFRRLFSHFFSTRSPTETKETHQQYTSQSPPSSGTTIPKLPTTTTITSTLAAMPGVTSDYGSSSKYDQIPGPLGLASASLQGKVALVTGAGKSESFCFAGVLLDLLSSRPVALDVTQNGIYSCRTGGQFTPTHVRPPPRKEHPQHTPHPRDISNHFRFFDRVLRSRAAAPEAPP